VVELRFFAGLTVEDTAEVLEVSADTIARDWRPAKVWLVPVLMLSGRDDSVGPVEVSQKPMFKALGTPEKDKRLTIYPGGHVDFMDRLEVVKEGLDWLDHYLGPVKLQR
jgi:alpha-beta hydrolase superfamily lysophospholipase